MKPMEEVPFGRRVVVREAAQIPHDFSQPNYVIPAGSEGVVDTGTIGMSSFLFDLECPVVFDYWIELKLPQTIGVPWEYLEFAECPSS